MNVWKVILGKPESEIFANEQKKFAEPNNLFLRCILGVFFDDLCDVYSTVTYVKELWDTLIVKYDALDTWSQLYIMESFHDCRMVNNRSMLEQTREVVCIVKELDLVKCLLPDKFVVGCIIANLIASLDVEEKARANDASKKEVRAA
ncbi:hypothetical protein GUJ93_ZPchr0008g13000 [Zizania palustris]|uniref:Uncharacterized protein n=1 Tax=Zizania palustris TaxID=103762 RepID=A0A8J5RKD2_ZIZPA|nr:hypothetical protein GUJ93_ZPchr0008g13000 [Zizania palustris]